MTTVIQAITGRKPYLGKYTNGRIAVIYPNPGVEDDDIVATVNIPEEDLAEDEVIIKNYSENEGVYEAMLAAGHIGPELRKVCSGYVQVPVCKLLIKPSADNQYEG